MSYFMDSAVTEDTERSSSFGTRSETVSSQYWTLTCKDKGAHITFLDKSKILLFLWFKYDKLIKPVDVKAFSVQEMSKYALSFSL